MPLSNREAPLPAFLQGRTGVVESYEARWHGRGIFSEKLTARLDRYGDRCEITGTVLDQDDNGNWVTAHSSTRVLTAYEWQAATENLDAMFWQQPSRDQAHAVMDGCTWTIKGYRNAEHHQVYRHSGSYLEGTGTAVFHLGERLARLAGFRRFENRS